ncbi:MAG: response regulator [Gammaproteobacteria bacterium]|nr:response regulator [Gammaproteobacteria bacterium]
MLPLLSYPISVMLVDDDPLFLQVLTDFLEKDYPLLTFNSPKDAVNFHEKNIELIPKIKFLRGCSEFDSYDISGHMPVDIDHEALKNMRNYREFAPEIGVIVVDYNMPEMNGIEVCRRLKDFPMKKILLTGEANEELATIAFNEGVIDCFIRKGSEALPSSIKYYLEVLTQEYLSNKTQHLLKHLEIDRLLPVSDPAFIRFFKEWCLKHRIREHYIIDQNANFLLVDENEKKYFFVIHTERTLNSFTDLHDDTEKNKECVEAVRLREKIPFFGENTESWEVDHGNWSSCFHAPNVFQGREKYYWLVI